MVHDSSSQPSSATLSASQLIPLLRAIADPEGDGTISPQDAASIERVETNLTRFLGLG
ncbi:MAG TPA: hypothetical protein VHF88_00440 [Thermoleophilaceae bacterium]|nr:hypothetical protein [Thermoleophilaceae bacterium]